MDKRFQVFVSSTYSDLKEERSQVMQAIMNLNCIPAGMEFFPASDNEQFEYIKRVINDSDYYVLIVGGRYGSLSEDGISYTEKEFDYAKSINLPILAFLHSSLDDIPLGKSELDPQKREMLNSFRLKVSTGRLVKFWQNLDELVGQVAISLSQTIMQLPAIGWVRANLQSSAESLQRENELRKELAETKEHLLQLENEKSDKESLANIASLDDMITIRYEHQRWSKQLRTDIVTPLSITLSWGELFSKLAPRLMDHPKEEYVKIRLSEILSSGNGITDGHNEVNADDFDTVKVQFLALKLVRVSYSKTTKGGMALFWSMTSKGEDLMIQRRVIRNSDSGQLSVE